MQNITLIFPDAGSIASFVISGDIKGAEISTSDQSLRAELSDEEISVACKSFGAIIEGEYIAFTD